MEDLLHHELVLGLPEGWRDKTEVVIAGPSREGSCPTVTVARIELSSPQTLEQFSAFQLHGLKELAGVKSTDIIEEGDITLGGLPAFARRYHLRFIGHPMMQRQIYWIRGQTAYVMTETSAAAHFEDDRAVFEAILSRVQFRLPPG